MTKPTITISIAIVTSARLIHQVLVYEKPPEDDLDNFAYSVAAYAYNMAIEQATSPDESLLNRSICAASDADQPVCQVALGKFDAFFAQPQELVGEGE